ncbi:MAG: hypothetical protein F4X15_07185 [Gemmatimonadetes bacterium]|nr:hypothetical protein [Gemmatimonadota bacterium]MYC91243.1 hypothetical protein [Gemmatimonadota bacterium]
MRSPADNLRQPFLAAILALALGCAAPEAGTDDAMADAEPAAAEVAEMPPQPMADPADVESIDAIITAVYEVISGDAGVERDWDRFRSLFLPQARLMPVSSQHGENGRSSSVSAATPDEFIEGSNDFFVSQGFYEVEIGSVTEQYGDIAHRFSSYASFRTDDPDEEPFNRGINSFQLLYDGERWWVLSIFWQHEPDAGPIPAEYLDEI